MTTKSAHRRSSGFRVIALGVCLAETMLLATPSMAANFEKLVMPGRVIAGHAEFEDDCGSCHDATSEQALPMLCTSCHEGIGQDRELGTGFHGLSEPARRNNCITCHTDHEGRDADIVELEAGLFDHALTNFPLQGAHLSAACADCHAPAGRMRDASTECGSCHRDRDVHEQRLGSACGDCHSQSTWQDAVFDHSSTGYTLTGAHVDVACGDCHQRNRFDQASPDCVNCHAVDDTHAGSRGLRCGSCHNTSSWDRTGFDHEAQTGFALQAGHSGLACGDCHARSDHTDDFSAGCAACHAVDDLHQGRLGTACADCHNAIAWSSAQFDHGETGFPLLETHAVLNCTACHKADVRTPLASECRSCHAFDDVHEGGLVEDCGACHSQSAWQGPVRFDHDLTDFPLLGLHAVAPCSSCHADNRFRTAGQKCSSCHSDDDPHEGTLGERCEACHTSNSWAASAFDHADTAFPLTGAHRDTTCNACHTDTAATAASAPSTCGACHRTDDIHDGQFGLECGSCHTTTSFTDIIGL
jgi:Cytochrome c7 and related cytochrome c/Class III cytochrome C family